MFSGAEGTLGTNVKNSEPGDTPIRFLETTGLPEVLVKINEFFPGAKPASIKVILYQTE